MDVGQILADAIAIPLQTSYDASMKIGGKS
jgi:hypothetical protein